MNESIQAAVEGRNLVIGYQDEAVLENMNIIIPQGEITAIVGPNGCGKSTLLKGLARVIPVRGGEIWLEGKPINTLSNRQAAQILSLLPQSPSAPAGLKVRELVGYGRYPWQKGFGTLSAKDREIIDQAMKATRTEELAERSVDELSGGQRQRAWIAMALAQDTPVILLDEPTTYLDMKHQLEILELLDTLNKKQNKTIALVIHDLNLAARFAHWMIAMKDGKILQEGPAEAVMTPEVLKAVFGLDALVEQDPWTKRPVMITYRIASENHK